MQLRISELSSGEFIIQRRCFFFWWVLATDIANTTFGDYHEAGRAVMTYRKQKDGLDVVQSWRV